MKVDGVRKISPSKKIEKLSNFLTFRVFVVLYKDLSYVAAKSHFSDKQFETSSDQIILCTMLKRLLELEWTFRHIAAFAPTVLLKVFDLLSFLGNHGYHEIKLKAFSCSIISRMQNC